MRMEHYKRKIKTLEQEIARLEGKIQELEDERAASYKKEVEKALNWALNLDNKK